MSENPIDDEKIISMTKIEEQWKILKQTNDWIKFSDTKATIFLTIYSVLITIIYSNAKDVNIALESSTILTVISGISAVSLCISSWYFVKCISPSLKNMNPTSIIYFGHIKEKFANSDEYKAKFDEVFKQPIDYELQLYEQIHTTSSIAWNKYSNVTIGIRWFTFIMVMLLLSIVIYLIN